jgi:hypothetical protein
MSKALFIDSATQTVREVEISGLADLQKLVRGFIETAVLWQNGDTMFVDEEGLAKDPAHWFRLHDGRVFAGNGVVVGREIDGEEYPNGYINADPVITLKEVSLMVTFITISERQPNVD